jgi:glycerol-3-phosphate cytidylyltransferase
MSKQLELSEEELSIKKTLEPLSIEKKEWLWVLSAFVFAPLLPEYVAPLVTLAAFCFYTQYIRSINKSFRFEKEQILMLIFIAWQFIGILRSNHIGDSVLFSFIWLFMFMGYIFTAGLIDSKLRLEQVLFAITATGGIAGSIGVGQIVLLNFGHWNLLKRASKLGDSLAVFISSDEFNTEKGKQCKQDYSIRLETISSLGFVSSVGMESSWDNKHSDISHYSRMGYYVTIVMGDDWKGKFDDLPCEVIYLPRTKGISSTKIRGMLND